MKKFLKENWIVLVIGCAFITSAIVAFKNNGVIQQHQVTVKQSELVERNTQEILTKIMHGLDLGVRGFALNPDEQMLRPYNEAVLETPRIFQQLDSLLTIQQYPAKNDANQVMAEVQQYIKLSGQMVQLAKNNDLQAIHEILTQDRGYEVWKKYSAFSTPLMAYEARLRDESLIAYQNAIRGNLILQALILILGLPMLYLFVKRVNNERQRRRDVLHRVDYADKTYVFNEGANGEVTEDINTRTVNHVRQASEFVASLENGNFDVQWEQLTETNKELNAKTLAGNLIRLRDRLKEVKASDEQRNWTNEGLAKFSELVRKHQHDPERLSFEAIAYLTKYLGAQQGSIFVLDADQDEQYLKLGGCYAFNKRKFIDKRIAIGSGIVGQTFLEGQPCVMTQVPQGYTHITSGLGEATPTAIAVVPVKHNDETSAVAEFASFSVFAPHQIEFIEKAGEFLASAMISLKTTAKMKQLLADAELREAMMREREEELRQNMEELQATQEQMMRAKQDGILVN